MLDTGGVVTVRGDGTGGGTTGVVASDGVIPRIGVVSIAGVAGTSFNVSPSVGDNEGVSIGSGRDSNGFTLGLGSGLIVGEGEGFAGVVGAGFAFTVGVGLGLGVSSVAAGVLARNGVEAASCA